MRIVIIADSVDLQDAGIHFYTRNMIEALQTYTNFEVICIRHGRRHDIQFENEVLVKPLLPFLNKDPFRIFWSVPRAIRKLNPDFVIEPAHFGPFNLPVNIKRITIIHDLTPIKFPQWHKLLSAKLQKLFLPSLMRRAYKVIVNSENTLADLHYFYPVTSQKAVCIYPGVNPFFFSAEKKIPSQKQSYFLSTGTIEPRKNLQKLLTAYTIFRRSHKKYFKLIIVGGKGWKSEEFYMQLKSHPFRDDIELRGYVTDAELKELYANATAFVYPSLYEGFGFPLVEAMVCGAPCIVSRISSLPELGGDAVIYFNPYSAGELSEKMKLVASSPDLQNELIKKGFEQVRKFSWSKFAARFDSEIIHTPNQIS